MINHAEILMARNCVKVQHKAYVYEGMKNIITESGFTVSEFLFGCSVMAIEKMNDRKLDFIKDSDRLIINNLRRAITHNQ